MLNAKQSRFASEYAIDLNATQAATRAGYSRKTAYSQGQRLLKKVDIARVVDLKLEELATRNEVTKDEIVSYLREAIRLAQEAQAPGAMAQAAYKLAQVCGVGAPQRAITTHIAPPSLPSLEELLARHLGKLD